MTAGGFGKGFGVALLAAVTWTAPVQAGEDVTITAFAAWQGGGTLFQTGTDEATFVGALAGPLYVQSDRGPVPSGQLICPTMLTVDLKTRAQTGEGRCTFVAEDGAKAFATIACEGYHLVGCSGELTFTGGTDRFAGIAGGGRAIVRSALGSIDDVSALTASQTAQGIVYLENLHYTLP